MFPEPLEGSLGVLAGEEAVFLAGEVVLVLGLAGELTLGRETFLVVGDFLFVSSSAFFLGLSIDVDLEGGL